MLAGVLHDGGLTFEPLEIEYRCR